MQLELTFDNDVTHLSSIHAFLSATMQQIPLTSEIAEQLGTLVEGAVKDAIVNAYAPSDQGMITLSIRTLHGKLEIRVRDFGIPKDVQRMERQLQPSDSTVINFSRCIAAGVADELHWLTFGPEGKALQIVKWLQNSHIANVSSAERIQRFSDGVPLAREQRYAIRRMRAIESEQVSQLMYRTYGNTYFNEDVYYPDRVAAQNESGSVLSYVAVDEAGEIAGHYAIERNQQGPVAEGGQAVVDPAHRGRGLLNRMKEFALEEAKQMELIGLYADAVTVHTLTQKSNVAHGGQITAVDLAISPSKEHFDTVQQQPQRVTCLLFFYWLRPPTMRVLHVPNRHRAIVGEIYRRLNCPIEFRDAQPPSGLSTIAVKIDSGASRANVNADKIGTNTIHLIRQARRELIERIHLEVVYVDLPIEDPASGFVAERLESDGFGFLGIAPHFSKHGDVLRLAYLVEPVDRKAIHLLEDAAGELVDYVLSEQNRVRNRLP